MNPVAKNEGLVVKEVDHELLIYKTDSNKAYCLNETSAIVWKSCDGKNSVEDISKKLSKHFRKAVNSDLVLLAIDQLKTDDLISQAPRSRFEGMSRREAIRKVGLASAIALPIVASLVAPTAAMAVACSSGTTNCTGCLNGTPCCKNPPTCTTTGTCQAGTCV